MNIDKPVPANPLSPSMEIETLKKALKTIESAAPDTQLKLETDTLQQLSKSDSLIGEMSRLSLATLRKAQAETGAECSSILGSKAMECMISCGASCSASFAMGALGSAILYNLKDIQNPRDYVLPILERTGPAGSPDYQSVPDTLTRLFKEVDINPANQKALLEAAGEALLQPDSLEGLEWFALRVRAVVKNFTAAKIAAEAIAAHSDRQGDAETLNLGLNISEKIRQGSGSGKYPALKEEMRETLTTKIMAVLIESVYQSRRSQDTHDGVLLHGFSMLNAFSTESADTGAISVAKKGLMGSLMLEGIIPLLQDPVNREILGFGKEMADLADSKGHPEVAGGIVDKVIMETGNSEIRDLPHHKKMLLLTFDPINESGLLYECAVNEELMHGIVNEVLDRITAQKEDPAASEEARLGRGRLENTSLQSSSGYMELREVFTRVLKAGEIREEALDELKRAGESQAQDDGIEVGDDFVTIGGITLPRSMKSLTGGNFLRTK